MFLPPPLFAADLGPLITGAILIISFIGWLSNIISSQQKPKAPQAPRQQARPRDGRVQDEIDAFLKEATGQSRQRPQRREPGREKVLPANEIEVVGTPKRPASKLKSAPKPKQPAPKAQPEPGRTMPGAGMAERHLAPDTLGQDLQQHLRTQREERLGASQTSGTGARSSSRLGNFSGDQSTGRKAADETLRRATTPASELLKLLRGTTGVRQAIILGEVLGRPRSTRR